MLQFMGLQRVGHNCATELNLVLPKLFSSNVHDLYVINDVKTKALFLMGKMRST